MLDSAGEADLGAEGGRDALHAEADAKDRNRTEPDELSRPAKVGLLRRRAWSRREDDGLEVR
jgi:hypothetical protein